MLSSLMNHFRSERGIALPLTISVLAVGGMLAAVTATSALRSNSQSTLDRNVKRAIGAADAGLNIATWRMNKFAGVVTTSQPCVTLNATSGQLGTATVVSGGPSNGWCPAQSEELGGSSSFTYVVSDRISATVGGQTVIQRKVVSTGIAGRAQRRATATINAPGSAPLFEYGVFSDSDMVMSGNSDIVSNVRTNGSISMANPAKICGNATVGPSGTVTGSGAANRCAGDTTIQAPTPFVLSPVTAPTSNDNSLLTGKPGWTAATRVLDLNNVADLTLAPGTYVLCRLRIKNTKLQIAAANTQPVKIYIDSPENCGALVGNATGMGSVLIESSGEVDNKSDNPALLQFFMVGSTNSVVYPTEFRMQNNNDTEFTLYSPASEFNSENQGKLKGAVAARKVTMSNKSKIEYDVRAGGIQIDQNALPVYTEAAWVECTAKPSGTAPDSGC